MPSLLFAPPKTLRKTRLLLFARQKIDIPVKSGKIPSSTDVIVGSVKLEGERTLWDNLPYEHEASLLSERNPKG